MIKKYQQKQLLDYQIIQITNILKIIEKKIMIALNL